METDFFSLLSSPVLVTIRRAGVCRPDALAQVCAIGGKQGQTAPQIAPRRQAAVLWARGEQQSRQGAAHTKTASVHTCAAL